MKGQIETATNDAADATRKTAEAEKAAREADQKKNDADAAAKKAREELADLQRDWVCVVDSDNRPDMLGRISVALRGIESLKVGRRP